MTELEMRAMRVEAASDQHKAALDKLIQGLGVTLVNDLLTSLENGEKIDEEQAFRVYVATLAPAKLLLIFKLADIAIADVLIRLVNNGLKLTDH